jgi:hypothetical protein
VIPLQEAFVENLDNGKFFDLLYENETDVLKLDLVEESAEVRKLYPFISSVRELFCQ